MKQARHRRDIEEIEVAIVAGDSDGEETEGEEQS
jgi:hypothetical protein